MATSTDTFGAQISALLNQKNSTLPSKCVHGNYIGIHDRTPEARAPYCTGCFPAGPSFETRAIHFPHHHRAGGLQANKKAPDGCPACSELIFYEVENGKRECAECREVYDARKR
jgi:hypothetical protein